MDAADGGDADANAACCYVYLRLPDAFIQIERRMTPALAGDGAAFVLYVSTAEADAKPPLAISPAARRLGLAADTPLGELRRQHERESSVRFVPAASWAAGGSTANAGEYEVVVTSYRRVAEQGPWALIRRVVEEGEGLALRKEGGGGEEQWVRIQGGSVERARALALDLQEEVRWLLGYELRIGAAPDLENARREARGLMLLPRPRKPADATVATTKPASSPSPNKRAAATAETQAQEEVEVAEYFCSVCRAFFFESTALLAHVQAHHPGQPSGGRAAGGGGEPALAGVGANAGDPVELEGPGQVTFSEVLAALSDPAAIEAFLADMGVADGNGSGGGGGGGGSTAAAPPAESFSSPSR